ncbi:MAG: prohibitin family protein, partial [Patescibacteria group bacterium]|nr:prohibitin family protein [Patescibacteria group bacterium]
VVQSKAEAEQAIEKARGESESILIEAKAKAEANRELTASLSPELLTYEALQKWNGTMPMVVGEHGALPFIQIPTAARKVAIAEQ